MEPKKSLILAGLLALIPIPADAAPPNLCNDVYLDEDGVPIHDATGVALSRYCEWTGPRAPIWDASVCCTFDAVGANCAPPSSTGGCASTEQTAMWCDYGARQPDGSVTCYQPFPSACDFTDCVDAPPGAPLEDATPLCCFAWGCFEPEFEEGCGGGLFGYCWAPYTNDDGTVGCADED